MEELPELLGRLEQLRFVEWDTHGASLVVFWGVSRAVSARLPQTAVLLGQAWPDGVGRAE